MHTTTVHTRCHTQPTASCQHTPAHCTASAACGLICSQNNEMAHATCTNCTHVTCIYYNVLVRCEVRASCWLCSLPYVCQTHHDGGMAATGRAQCAQPVPVGRASKAHQNQHP